MSDERLLSTFLDLVRIDSPSGEESACARFCARELEALGFVVRYDDSAAVTGSDTGNLIAERVGDSAATLVLSAHFDCVEPCRGVEPVVADGIVYSAGDTVLGADDKAGLATAIEAARRLVAGGEACPTLRCVFTVKEELGLVGAKALARDAVAGDLCLVLDADGTPGGIVVAAPTHYTFTATFFGRSSHAGVAPEKGVSALKMAADAVSAIEIGRLDDATTANIGTVEGGTATNVVAGRARVTGECRSLDRARVEEVRGRMHEQLLEAARRHGGSVEIEWNLEYEGFSCAEDDAAVSLVRAACGDAGIEPRTFTTGGGSDANVIAAYGTPTLALACGMSGVHATSEQIAVADLEALTRLVVAAARRLVAERD